MSRNTEIELWIRSTDLDADGIVNNSRFFQFFEQARLEHLIALGVLARPRPPGVSERTFTIAETTCRFLAPLHHRERIMVRASTREVGRRSFVLTYQIRRPGDGSISAEGSSAQVWLGDDGRPATLPEDVRHALTESLSAAEHV